MLIQLAKRLEDVGHSDVPASPIGLQGKNAANIQIILKTLV